MTNPGEDLATIARTIAATCVQVELVLADDRDRDLEAGDLGFLFDGGGQCFVLIGPGSAAPAGEVVAECRPAETSLGHMQLRGHCGWPQPLDPWSEAVENALAQRPEWRQCLSEEGAGPSGIRIVPMLLDAVHLTRRSALGAPGQLFRVSQQAYVRASADPWLSGGPKMGRWLEEHRQGELRVLAERTARATVRSDDVVVSVDGISAGCMGLCLLNPHGVSRVDVALPPDLECPCAIATWLDTQIPRG